MTNWLLNIRIKHIHTIAQVSKIESQQLGYAPRFFRRFLVLFVISLLFYKCKINIYNIKGTKLLDSNNKATTELQTSETKRRNWPVVASRSH